LNFASGDSYKVSHYQQYPPNTKRIYSYFESRGNGSKEYVFDEVTFFGLQYFIQKYLVGNVVTQEKIKQAKMVYDDHFIGPKGMFYEKGWQHILDKHDGKLPIVIKAVPEGTVVGTKNVLFTLENTDDECFWLVNFLETLLVEVWYPMSVATSSREQKKIIGHYLKKTGTDPLKYPLYPTKLHDFGYRGVSSHESAGIGGAGHLVNFAGTDTVAALVVAKEFYSAKDYSTGNSIPASEHSTITSWGKDHEKDALENMLNQYPDRPVACVSDSYNVYRATEKIWGEELNEMIMKRDRANPLVIRPDSGEPTEVIPRLLRIICAKFHCKEVQGADGVMYKVIDAPVGLIQGDGVSIESIPMIMEAMILDGFAAENIVLGSGGALLQKLNRDTLKCAFKCSEITRDINGKRESSYVFKDPIEDRGKRSKQGVLTLYKLPATSFKAEVKLEIDGNELVPTKVGVQVFAGAIAKITCTGTKSWKSDSKESPQTAQEFCKSDGCRQCTIEFSGQRIRYWIQYCSMNFYR
jgi:nicotinamide phosphoribosyltransferase